MRIAHHQQVDGTSSACCCGCGWRPFLLFGVLVLAASSMMLSSSTSQILAQLEVLQYDSAFYQPTNHLWNATNVSASASSHSNANANANVNANETAAAVATVSSFQQKTTTATTIFNVSSELELKSQAVVLQVDGIPSLGPSVPYFPVLPKPNPFPTRGEVSASMKNHTTRTAGQHMLDLAIIGFAKCGTSTMMYWLGQHPDIQIPPYEVTVLSNKEAWNMVSVIFQETSIDPKKMRGYKAPNDIGNIRSVRLLREYFPQTKLIVGLRHPVWMLESFYNHRIQNGFKIREFRDLEYSNMAGQFGVSWSRSEYHGHLAELGKTNVSSEEEMMFMPRSKKKHWKNTNYPLRSPHKVFLYDMEQLSASTSKTNNKNKNNATLLLTQFTKDLSNYLGLGEGSQELPPPIHFKPGKDLKNSKKQETRNAQKVNICDDEYKAIRENLLKISGRGGEWIIRFFLQSPDVIVSNREHFIQILESYQRDPCADRVAIVNNQTINK